MINYDIGILSFWNVPNYGTFAQEYALQRVISELFPENDVRQIAHLDERHFGFYFDERTYHRSLPIYKRRFWRSIFNPGAYGQISKETKLKQERFSDAYNKILHTDSITTKNVKRYHFSNVVLGSDIIWDYSQEVFNRDRLLFGVGFDSTKVCSYAASFGVAGKNGDIPAYVKRGIKNLSDISVRDENSACIVEQITGKRPEVVLDPVWLWDFTNDKNVVRPQEDNYILVYGQDFTEVFIKSLDSYAKEHGLRTIVLDCNDDNYSWCDKLIKQSELDPLEWIGYFYGADAVATSTFHGLTFGLLFNKRIAFCKTDFIMAKIKKLLQDLRVDIVFEDKDNAAAMLNYSWDYSYINLYIEEERKKSKNYLMKACKDSNEQR